MTHLTWSIEVADKCPCGGEPVLITNHEWEAHEQSCDERLGEGTWVQHFAHGVHLEEEITGQVCIECGRLTSLSLNIHET